ncbi:Protein FAM86A [Termitomyces sp. J132]|nr:hypothetical protein C0989_008079 [Termitomyces sp. Mn162]KAH0591537.1 hypothetical protein H2248_001599 [Termitomyces sp. 'cryptogamus']KNZ73009.1 Protein FAM86A [Termitomyces sp. J132]
MAANPPYNPTIFLPSLSRLSSHSTQQVSEALEKLRTLYWPPLLPAQIALPKRTIPTKIHDNTAPDSGYASAEDSDDEGEEPSTITHVINGSEFLEVLRADTLEREYAVRWTTGFISRSDSWIENAVGVNDKAARAQLLDDSTKLLSAFIGDELMENENDERDEGEATMVRSVSFPTSEDEEIEVQLHDAPMLEDDHTSVGLQSWGSCIRFGKRICANPTYFSLPPLPYMSDRPLRVLELGAGTGLLSILVAKLLRDAPHPPTIIATDFHPDVLANLIVNVSANLSFLPSSSSSTHPYPQVQVHTLDWEHPTLSPPLDEAFDVILAADVIYHPDHARWIRGCVEQLLRRPTSSSSRDGGVFWMFNAVREVGRHEGLAESVERVFNGGTLSRIGDREESGEESGSKAMRLRILEMEEAEKEAGVGRVDESGYKLFEIGWAGLKRT